MAKLIERKSLTIPEEAKLYRLKQGYERHSFNLSMVRTAAIAMPHNDDLQAKLDRTLARHRQIRDEIADLLGEYEGTLWLIANP